MLASYFGTIADYRTVKFNVSSDTLPQDNSIVFAHPGQTVAGIDMPKRKAFTLKIIHIADLTRIFYCS